MSCQYLTNIDFQCIGQVAQHCDTQKLCIAINEAKDFDLMELFCEDERISEAFEHCEDTSGEWFELWNGGSYTNKCGKKKTHFGLKRVWVYYAYSRYIMINGYNDTPTGFKQKTNDFSLPTPIKELQFFEQKYRDMGFTAFKKVLDFINKDSGTCEKCECEKCDGNVTTKTGFKSKIINKDEN